MNHIDIHNLKYVYITKTRNSDGEYFITGL